MSETLPQYPMRVCSRRDCDTAWRSVDGACWYCGATGTVVPNIYLRTPFTPDPDREEAVLAL
jgi:hypothetical protein